MTSAAAVSELHVALPGGRVLHAYDTGSASGTSGLTVVWQHGSPQTGRLPDPLRTAAAARGIRLLSYGRPSYGGSTPQPGRTVGDAAADVVAVLDAAGRETPDGLVDDDVALAHPWGFDVRAIGTPVLLVHGCQDRVIPFAHSKWLSTQLPHVELWVRPRDGHISVLEAVPVALDWLLAQG